MSKGLASIFLVAGVGFYVAFKGAGAIRESLPLFARLIIGVAVAALASLIAWACVSMDKVLEQRAARRAAKRAERGQPKGRLARFRVRLNASQGTIFYAFTFALAVWLLGVEFFNIEEILCAVIVVLFGLAVVAMRWLGIY